MAHESRVDAAHVISGRKPARCSRRRDPPTVVGSKHGSDRVAPWLRGLILAPIVYLFATRLLRARLRSVIPGGTTVTHLSVFRCACFAGRLVERPD